MIFVVSSGFGCKWNPFKKDPASYDKVTLEYWGVWDTPGQLKALMADYNTSHPTIKVKYKNFNMSLGSFLLYEPKTPMERLITRAFHSVKCFLVFF